MNKEKEKKIFKTFVNYGKKYKDDLFFKANNVLINDKTYDAIVKFDNYNKYVKLVTMNSKIIDSSSNESHNLDDNSDYESLTNALYKALEKEKNFKDKKKKKEEKVLVIIDKSKNVFYNLYKLQNLKIVKDRNEVFLDFLKNTFYKTLEKFLKNNENTFTFKEIQIYFHQTWSKDSEDRYFLINNKMKKPKNFDWKKIVKVKTLEKAIV